MPLLSGSGALRVRQLFEHFCSQPDLLCLLAGKVTGSSLAEFLGLFEASAGKALTKAGVYAKMRDHAKLTSKAASLQNTKHGLVEVDPQTQVFFDWGHKHEANGILSYLKANPHSTVHEVGFVMLDPSLQRLPQEVSQGINPANLPAIGSSPDGIIVEAAMPSRAHPSLQALPAFRTSALQPHQHWRASHPSQRRVLEIKAKTPFRPDTIPGVWRWLGSSCKPYAKILPQYFAQAQLNMLVTESQSCHLLCYTVKGGSTGFDIPLHKQWCNQMLHWVSQLNTQYVLRGVEPPEDVFWDQEAYRGFVAMTRDACQSLDNSGQDVPSFHGSVSSPWFLPTSDATVPCTPDTDTAGHFSQQQQQQQLLGQLLHRYPPGWQQQQQPPPLVSCELTAQLHSGQVPRAAAAEPVSAAPLRLLAAAALPLPEEDVNMEDADQQAAQGDQSAQPEGHPGQPQIDAARPVGVQGLAAWMQHIWLQHCVDLRSLLDSSCQRALSLRAAAEVRAALEHLAQEVKKYTNAACMRHLTGLGNASSVARQPAAQQGEAARGSSVAVNGLTGGDPRPMAAPHPPHDFRHYEAGPAGLNAPADSALSSRQPSTSRAAAAGSDRRSKDMGLQHSACRAYSISPQHTAVGVGGSGAALTGSSSMLGSGTADKAPAMTATASRLQQNGPSAQRALWPDQNSCYVTHVTAAAEQPSAAATTPLGDPPRPSRAGAARSEACLSADAELYYAQPEIGKFDEQLMTLGMSSSTRKRLCSILTTHQNYLKPQDFDAAILSRLNSMPEHKAMSVLNQAESASWPDVRNNTKLIMSWCCKWA